MAEAPCLRYSLACWTTLFLSSDRRVGTGQRWEKPEQQALAETSTSPLPRGQLCHLLNHWNSVVFHSSVCGSGVWREETENPLWEGFCAGSSQYLSSSSTGWPSPLISESAPQREGETAHQELCNLRQKKKALLWHRGTHNHFLFPW